jgi:orotidine-5'-phosphate decarboxylase
MGKDVIVACDFSNKEEVIGFLSKFKEEKPFVKIGMELFYGEGPEIVKIISSMVLIAMYMSLFSSSTAK